MPRKPSADNASKRSNTNVRRTIGANVKARRLTLGWSQQELADLFGVSRAAVSQYEIGTGEVNAGDLPRLAKILGVGLLDFYGYAPPVSAARAEKAEEKGVDGAEPDENANHANVAPDARQVEFYDKADGLYVSHYDNHMIGSLGKAIGDADREAVLPLLRAILDLAPGDRETVRRVVEAMRGGPPHPGRR